MVEIRWHGRRGQGTTFACRLLALAQLGAGRGVQALAEYGPEATGAPMRAYNRVDSRPIRRHDGVRAPAVVVVLDPALVPEGGVADGLGARGLLLVNWAGAGGEAAVGAETGFGGRIVAVDASALARRAGSRFANTVLVGALAALLGEPGPDDLDRAARALFAPPEQAALAAARRALALGIGSMAGRERGDVPWSA